MKRPVLYMPMNVLYGTHCAIHTVYRVKHVTLLFLNVSGVSGKDVASNTQQINYNLRQKQHKL